MTRGPFSPFGPQTIFRGTQTECTECGAVALFGHSLIHGPRCSGWPRAADLTPQQPGGWSDCGPDTAPRKSSQLSET